MGGRCGESLALHGPGQHGDQFFRSSIGALTLAVNGVGQRRQQAQMALPPNVTEDAGVGHVVLGLPAFDEHPAAALVQLHPALGQVTLVAPDEEQ